MKDPETEPTFAVAPSFEHDADAVDRKSPKRRHIMSQEQLQAFISQVQNNKQLQDNLNSALDVQTVASIAQKAGFNASFANTKQELTTAELEGAAAAGGTVTLSTSTCSKQSC
jgi:predicted ribosomally synthesized peptide with nif11-like leader